jgi:hypothetical protein
MIRALWNWFFPPAPRYPTIAWLQKELGTDGYYYFRPLFTGSMLAVQISRADFNALLCELNDRENLIVETLGGGLIFDGCVIMPNASLNQGVVLK